MKEKISKTINEQEFFQEYLDSVPNNVKNYVRLSSDISTFINSILRRNKLSQRDLSNSLGKNESEVSKWLSGSHNFTLKSLAKIEDILEERIVLVPLELKSYCFKTDSTNTFFVSYQKTEQTWINSASEAQMTNNEKQIDQTPVTIEESTLNAA